MANTQYALPEKLFAVLLPEVTFPQDYTGTSFRVRPAFVVDALYPRLLVDARKWAAHFREHPQYKDAVVEEVELDNAPLEHVTVVGIEHRREGGVAIKVVTPQSWLVDLREPEFMEAAITGKLVAGGVLQGPLVWTRGVGQMRLVRVGDATYTARAAYGLGVK